MLRVYPNSAAQPYHEGSHITKPGLVDIKDGNALRKYNKATVSDMPTNSCIDSRLDVFPSASVLP